MKIDKRNYNVGNEHDPGGKVRLKIDSQDMKSTAYFSDDKKYRYRLERRWDDAEMQSGGVPLFIMMNPSTADIDVDDPTVRRCVGYAKRWNMKGLVVCNLFAYRATYPKMLLEVEDPVGVENDNTLQKEAERAEKIICAFGLPPKQVFYRVHHVIHLLRSVNKPLYALQQTQAGWPGHPLYLRKNIDPVLWNPQIMEEKP